VLAQRAVWPDKIRPLRRIEYESLVEQGLLADSRVELLLGTLVDMSPQGPLHAEVVRRLTAFFVRQLPSQVHTRVQSPLALADDSEPEPDIAVVPAGDYTKAHPDRALLIVEVADTSLQKDRGVKTALYAMAGVPEFWLVSLADRTIEVHRQPSTGRYTDIQKIDTGGSIAPAAFPTVSIAASEILP
jgi:Uma2 family endonuclease